MTLAAVGRQTQKDPAERLHTIDRVVRQVFFINRAPFVGRDVAALKAGGDQLIFAVGYREDRPQSVRR